MEYRLILRGRKEETPPVRITQDLEYALLWFDFFSDLSNRIDHFYEVAVESDSRTIEKWSIEPLTLDQFKEKLKSKAEQQSDYLKLSSDRILEAWYRTSFRNPDYLAKHNTKLTNKILSRQ